MKKSILLLIYITLSISVCYAQNNIITTVAGNGISGYFGDGGAATLAELNNPGCVVFDATGNIYISENSRIRKVNSSGLITTVAGNGTAGYTGDGGAATATELYAPTGVAIDGLGNFYIADELNNRIRKVNSLGIITTIAGNGTLGYSGDGGAATAAALYWPGGVFADGIGNIYIADAGNNRIRKVNSSGIITTIAGNGIGGYSGDGGVATVAELYNPGGVFVDGAGIIYIADSYNHRIRKVNSTGIITTIAGNGTLGYSGDGGVATIAEIGGISGIALDGAGNIYIADINNNRIRKVHNTGIITTIAGNSIAGYSGDGSAATSSQLYNPRGISVDGAGNCYIADGGNYRVRKISGVSGNSILCGIGSTSTFTDSMIGGSWSSSNTAIATVGSATGVVTGVSAGIVTITFTGSSAIATATISICPYPNAGMIFGNSILCASTNDTLRDTTLLGTKVWSSMYPSIATIDTNGVVHGIYAGVDTIKITVSNSCGSVIAIKPITVNPLPLAGTIFGNSTLCASSNDTLRDTTLLGAKIWSSLHPTIATIDTGGVVHGIIAGLDTIKLTVSNSCGTVFTSKPITVNPLPLAGTLFGFTAICAGTNGSLNDTTFLGTKVWSSLHTTIATVTTGGVVHGVTAGLDTIKLTVANSCGSVFTTLPITVNPSPNAGTIIGATTVCAGATTSWSDTGFVGVSTWSSYHTSLATVTDSGVVSGISAGIDTIKYMVTNSCGTAFTNKVITINPLPNAGTITGPTSVCNASFITLTDAVSGGVWSASNGNASVLAGIVTGLVNGIDTIRYVVSNSCGSDTASLIITINPYAGAITGFDSVCVGSTLMLTDTIPGGIWSSASSVATVTSSGVVTGVSAGSGSISYSVTNVCGTNVAVFPITVLDVSSWCTMGIPALAPLHGLMVFPNPNDGTFIITFSSSINENALFTVINLLGQKVMEFPVLANKEIEIKSDLPAGIYYVSVVTTNERYVEKITIMY